MASLSNFNQRSKFYTAEPVLGRPKFAEMKIRHQTRDGARFSETYTLTLAPLAEGWRAADIITRVALFHGLTHEDLIGPRRARIYARPRQIAMYLCRQHCRHLSLPAIGRAFGNRDHTTVMHACKKVDELYQVDPEFRRQFKRCKDLLEAKP